jgi:hypothetical protein
MKYILESHRTRKIIEETEYGREVFAKFFFYDRGDALQKSIEGLLRSLLIQVLEALPNLLELFFSAPENGWKPMVSIWTEERLKTSFRAIANAKSLSKTIYLFVDGLDEFDGKDADIAAFFKDLVENQDGFEIRFKACLASRSHTAFQESFRKFPSLEIHKFTECDIIHFVSKSLQDHSQMKDLVVLHGRACVQNFMNLTVQRASGVFLWIRLVIPDLYEGLCDGDSLEELQRRLDLIPSDLEDLYFRMCRKVDPRYFKDMAHIFRLLQVSKRTLTLFETAEAVKPVSECFERKIQPVDQTFRQSQSLAMERRIISRCGGLVEVLRSPNHSENSSQAILPKSTVRFIHQTVQDFLRREEVWGRLFGTEDLSLQSPEHSLFAGFVRELKSKTSPGPTLAPYVSIADRIIVHCDYLGENLESTKLFEEMSKALAHLCGTHCLLKSPDFPLRNWIQLCGLRWSLGHWQDNLLSLAIELGLTHYFLSQVELKPSILEEKRGRPLLHYAAEGFRRDILPKWRNLDIIQCILQHNGDVNHVYDGCSSWELLITDGDFGLVDETDLFASKHASLGNIDIPIRLQNYRGALGLMIQHGGNICKPILCGSELLRPVQIFLRRCGRKLTLVEVSIATLLTSSDDSELKAVFNAKEPVNPEYGRMVHGRSYSQRMYQVKSPEDPELVKYRHYM